MCIDALITSTLVGNFMLSLLLKIFQIWNHSLNNVTFNDTILSMLSKLSLLGFISLKYCDTVSSHLKLYHSPKNSAIILQIFWWDTYKAPFTGEKIWNRIPLCIWSRCLGLHSTLIFVNLTRNSKISIRNRLYLEESTAAGKL